MLLDHPQVDVIDGLETLVLHGVERNVVLAADAVTVVPVDQRVAPEHQRVAAAFGEQAAFQRLVLVGRERVDVSLEFFVDDDMHDSATERRDGGGGILVPAAEPCRNIVGGP